MGGHLVTIRSAEEEAWLKNRFEKRAPFWIGTSDESSEGTWSWYSLESPAHSNWNPGEPNGNRGENFAFSSWYGGGGWIDVDDSGRYFGMIESLGPMPGSAADLDGDSDVDIDDFLILAARASGPAVPQVLERRRPPARFGLRSLLRTRVRAAPVQGGPALTVIPFSHQTRAVGSGSSSPSA